MACTLVALSAGAQQSSVQPLTEPARIRDAIRRLATDSSTLDVTLTVRPNSIPLIFGHDLATLPRNETLPSTSSVLKEIRQSTLIGRVIWAGDKEFKFQRRGGELELRLYYDDVESIRVPELQLAAVFVSTPQATDSVPSSLGQANHVPAMRQAVQVIGGNSPFVEITLSESAVSSLSARLANAGSVPGNGRKVRPIKFDPVRQALVGKVTATYENDFELDVGPSRVRIAYQDVFGVGSHEPETWAMKTDRVLQGIVGFPFRLACILISGNPCVCSW